MSKRNKQKYDPVSLIWVEEAAPFDGEELDKVINYCKCGLINSMNLRRINNGVSCPLCGWTLDKSTPYRQVRCD